MRSLVIVLMPLLLSSCTTKDDQSVTIRTHPFETNALEKGMKVAYHHEPSGELIGWKLSSDTIWLTINYLPARFDTDKMYDAQVIRQKSEQLVQILLKPEPIEPLVDKVEHLADSLEAMINSGIDLTIEKVEKINTTIRSIRDNSVLTLEEMERLQKITEEIKVLQDETNY